VHEDSRLEANQTKKTIDLATKAAVEYSQNQKAACTALKETKHQGTSNQKLWKEGNKSRLIELGMVLIALPEPTPVSIVIGSGMVAAGAVQKGIKNQSLYMEDIPKDLKLVFREINSQRANLKL
jgi:hypothetical protein